MIATPLLSGCSGWQSALDPKGPAAHELARLIWFFTALCAAVWLLVMIALIWALLRRGARRIDPLALNPRGERRSGQIVSIAVGATAVILIGLTLLSYFANRSLA